MIRTDLRPLAALAAAAAVLGLAGASAQTPAQTPVQTPAARPHPIVLRYASPYPPSHPFSRADIAWMKSVEAESQGRLKIQPFWGGTLMSADNAVLELRHGMADLAQITPIYMRGGTQAIKLQLGFYGGAKTPAEQVAIYRCLQREFPILRQEMAGMKVLAIQGGNLPTIVTRDRPVRTLAEIRGLRLRSTAELSQLLRSFGGDPVTMPMGETYSALSKGVLDGVVAPADTIKSLHFSEVAKYRSGPTISRGAYPSRAISDRAWKRLPGDLQALLARSERVWENEINTLVVQADKEGAAFGDAHGIKTIPIAPAEQERFDRAYNEMSLKAAIKTAPAYGPKMFYRAQALVRELRAGRTPACSVL